MLLKSYAVRVQNEKKDHRNNYMTNNLRSDFMEESKVFDVISQGNS